LDHKRELRFKTRIFTVKTGKLSGFLKKRITKMGAYIQPKRMVWGAVRAVQLASFVLDVIRSTLLITGDD